MYTRMIVAVAVATGLAATFLVNAAPAAAPTAPTTRATAVHTTAPRCSAIAPVSAAGFTAMFNRVPVAQWGGADVSLSVKLTATRSIWLYGDTLSTGRFVHSTAIVQDRGCLHVSHAGAQLLPNDSTSIIYWIDSATRVTDTAVNVRAMQVRVGTASAWDFHLTGLYRTARVNVTATGDATFARWISSDHAAATKPALTKTLMQCQIYRNGVALPGSPPQAQLCPGGTLFSYNPQTHPQFKLTSGNTLVTVCFNSNGPLTANFANYRPRFFDVQIGA